MSSLLLLMDKSATFAHFFFEQQIPWKDKNKQGVTLLLKTFRLTYPVCGFKS